MIINYWFFAGLFRIIILNNFEMVNQFNIPFGIVINKADLKSASQEQLNKYIKKSNYEILGRINFDLSIPEAMS